MQTLLEKQFKKYSDQEVNDMLIAARKEAGLSNLYFHNKYVLSYKDMTEYTHAPSCAFLETWRYKRGKLFVTPRDTFKTSQCTVGYTTQLIAKYPDIKILITSEKVENSKVYLQSIKDHLANNPTYRETYDHLYTDYYFDRWDSECINIRPNKDRKNEVKQKEHTIDIAGIGTTTVGMHYDLIIFVDPHSQKNVATEDQIRKVIVYFKLLDSIAKTYSDVFKGKGRIIVEMTRWHWLDLPQHLLDNEQHNFEYYIKGCYSDPSGEGIGTNDRTLYFPERLSQEVLDSKLATYGTYLFSCLYLSAPQSDKEKIFKPEIASYYRNLPDRKIDKWLICDPSISEKENADEFPLICVGIDKLRNAFYIIDRVKVQRKQPAYAISEIIAAAQKNFNDTITTQIPGMSPISSLEPFQIAIEGVAFQKIYKFELERELSRQGQGRRIVELKPGGRNKRARISALQPYYETGRLLLRAGNENEPSPDLELLMQMDKFPYDKDDQIDCVAYALDLISQISEKPFEQKSYFRDNLANIQRFHKQSGLVRRYGR